MQRENIYQLLKIRESATPETVKKAFREFAKDHHPDFFPGDVLREERFKRVNAAYQTWKLIENTLVQIRRLRTIYKPTDSAVFKPWTFSCRA